ncbi:MAG: BrnA antitoxin family protein [Waterburya sp.]
MFEKNMNISRKRLKEIENISDHNIYLTDILELYEHFWETTKLVKPITKQAIFLRIDNDVLQWLKIKIKTISL